MHGLGLGLEGPGLGLEGPGLGLEGPGLGLEGPSLVNIPGTGAITDAAREGIKSVKDNPK